VPRVTPTLYLASLPAPPGRTIQVSLTWNRTTNKLTIGLTAYAGAIFLASATSAPNDTAPDRPLNFTTQAFPFAIPSGATAYAQIFI
jgi:hypothetical protein